MVLPENDAIQVPLNARLTWNHVDGYQTYGIKIAKDGNFNDIFSEQSGLQFSFFDCTNLMENTRYYWMVNASNQYNTGAWSEVRTFVSKDPANVIENNLNEFVFEAYPNPFSEKITFKVQTTENSVLKFEIYNYLGLLIDDFVINNSQLNSGLNLVTYNWEAIEQPSGIYKVVLKFGNKTKSINLVLMK